MLKEKKFLKVIGKVMEIIYKSESFLVNSLILDMSKIGVSLVV